ncbi:hypothetical protein PRIPAC_81023 [Pristionchus pacificus]|nr:hypothetical protein PRIPAC_81023 [Pristionchus pacificus]
MSYRYDIVVYGATGFTGGYVLRTLANEHLFKGKSIAVAGRDEGKLISTLEAIEKETGNKNVRMWPIILADSSDEKSLENMAKQAKVIINTVGPYILYGESVVRAAINNGANHVDISGEPTFLETMDLKYRDLARENGVYVIGACGWDSIPCDLGIDFLKKNFNGRLAYAETCVRVNRGPSGYAVNSGTYESLILGIKSKSELGEAKLHQSVMPKGVPKSETRVPFRFPLSKMEIPSVSAWVMPFLGPDKLVMERSQYYDYHENGTRPVPMRSFVTFGSLFNMLLITIWVGIVGFFTLFSPSRRFLLAYPDVCSFGMFKKTGPTKEQIKEASFDYFFFGTGWAKGETPESTTPTKKLSAVCHGPDPGYVGTSACVCSTALALLDDNDKLPQKGGVFTPASAFRDTRIYEYLRTMGVSFDLLANES